MSTDGFVAAAAELEHLPVAAGIIDVDGTILAVNAAAGRLFGREAAQLIGQKAPSLAPGSGQVWPEIVDGARAGAHHGDITIGTRALHYVAALRGIGDRSVVVLVAIEVAARGDTLGLVVGGIAHDFNNQLVSVLAEATAARETQALDPQVRDALARIEAAAQRMALLTRQLLSYAGRGRVVSEVFDPDELLRETIDDITRTLRADSRLSMAFGPPLTVRADRTLLREVIVNLVTNASDALSAAGGSIAISTAAIVREGETWWRLAVSDDGAGMAPEVIPRIFDPFFTTKQDRHGLGLSAVHGIVRRFGGEITIDSEPGRGTAVHVMLPTTGGQPRQRRPRTASETSRSLRGLSILVADDEPTVRATLRRLFERRGATVVIATDGEEAEVLLGQNTYALVVFDVMMPKRTGYQLVPVARARQPRAKILLMSGYTDSERGSSDQDDGDAFLEKPFTAKQLDEAIDSLIGPLAAR